MKLIPTYTFPETPYSLPDGQKVKLYPSGHDCYACQLNKGDVYYMIPQQRTAEELIAFIATEIDNPVVVAYYKQIATTDKDSDLVDLMQYIVDMLEGA